MATYSELQEQIKELQAEAERLRQEELHEVINDIKAKITLYNIKANELGFSDSSSNETKEDNKTKKKPLPAKYRSPDNANEWNGRGPKPKWFKDWITSGKDINDLAITHPE
ncbi:MULTISPECIES: H-NS family nucleoid-associated regulatory protein [Methylomonas]|uniref:DNA-binding protein H-NS-like C-terminal domain-containing protein n=2 Tax=Methylomonas TaxID=416 RepID=A0A126T673_9GAMM|nr:MULTISPECIES: H-NS histone family protein [Methylomonas]AMK77577.1 hypothetical protein JT25_013980 [Methylomonas denitrificans]OAI05157.1 hypothetical protein A1342_12145 [Methylomonas methanica]TCV84380.1 DNA-binding protein H-NS [Methylomonas methanica]